MKQEFGLKPRKDGLKSVSIPNAGEVYWNLSPAGLVEEAICNKEGVLTDTGALMCDTDEFTGRSPKDRFIVKDEKTVETVWWGDINIPFPEDKFDSLLKKVTDYLSEKKLYIRDAYAGALPEHRLNLRVVNTLAWHNFFCHNMFLRPGREELQDFDPDYTIICAPGFKADPEVDGTRQHNFAILNLSRKMILIGGTAYAGEMKKGIFSVLNYLLPQEKDILPMHCSANIGKRGDTAVFFGLSGTGKTTLSADPDRRLIGDDEHGWTKEAVFNFEGGCYAKTVDITRENEPQIWDAIKWGTIVENCRFFPGTRTVDFTNTSVTKNTRTAYPIDHIENAAVPSVGGIPENIFFLTCDAFGVLPPISRLSKEQAMYHFISGYTAKVAGTEAGVSEPQRVFSACFGAPFLPLHPTRYAEMLGRKMDEQKVKVWLINTGWVGGPFGVGNRIKLKYTRAMITAALEQQLDTVEYEDHPVFGVSMPLNCPGVPTELLNPRNSWEDRDAYDEKASQLAKYFNSNFKQFEEHANEEILSGGPHVQNIHSL